VALVRPRQQQRHHGHDHRDNAAQHAANHRTDEQQPGVTHGRSVRPSIDQLGELMPTQRPTLFIQIRVIGPADHTRQILALLAEQALPLFGRLATCTTHVRSARRRGYVRAYFTVTPQTSLPTREEIK
jgi:hypothetical protein